MARNLSKFRLALIQFAVQANKQENLSRAVKFIAEAAQAGANVIALPECFNCPYGTEYFEDYAESIPGDSSEVLSKAAKDNKVFLIGGSIPEKAGTKIFNTCAVFDPSGTLLVKHRKVHLFDIDIPGKITFEESKILSPGNHLTTFNTGYCKIGIGICYDMRFAEMAQLYAQNDCKLLIYPGAFNMTTGPLHWELLQKARAIDNQVYVAAVSPARDNSAKYVAWGHSTITNPWGKVIAGCEEKEQIIYADIDLDVLKEVRDQIPITKQKRVDLYSIKSGEDVMVCY